MTRLTRLMTPAIAATMLLSANAQAQVDQQNTTFVGLVGSGTGYRLGQSFTPTLTGLNYVTLNLNSSSGTTSAQASVSIFQGAGFGGTNLATSNVVTLVGTANQAYTFNFAGLVALTPGNTYTFDVTTLSGTLQAQYSNDNPYAGGTYYQQNGAGAGTAFASVDLRFAEGIAGAAPEPSVWALMILGFGVAGGTLRRRRQGSRPSRIVAGRTRTA